MRALVTLVAYLGALGLASVADAQQPASLRHIGVLLVGFSPESKEAQQFRQGLGDAGYAEGRDVVIEWRSANGDYARVPELVADLVRRNVDVIVVDTTVAALAVKRVTSTIPIVVAVVADPVGSGLVASLAHPGGNVTGLSTTPTWEGANEVVPMGTGLSAKRLELLKEAIPRLTRVAVLWNPDTPPHTKAVQELKAVAPSLSIELSFVGVRTPEEIGPAFSAVSRANAQALDVLTSPLSYSHRMTLAKLASKARLPSISGSGSLPTQAD